MVIRALCPLLSSVSPSLLSVPSSFCIFPPEAPCHAVSACTNAQLALCTGESGEHHAPVDVMATAAAYGSRRLD